MTAQVTPPRSSAIVPVAPVAAVRVWILPPQYRIAANGRDGYTFQWSLKFVECKRLIPVSSTESAGGMGNASFTLLRKEREENGVAQTDDALNSQVVVGAYICITLGMGDTFDPSEDGLAKVRYWGWLSSIDYAQVAGTSDQRGTASASGLGSLLDGCQITGWQKIADGGYPAPINSPPTANISIQEGDVIGNAVILSSGDDTGRTVFARFPEECGKSASNYWSRMSLLRHITRFCHAGNIPAINIDIDSALNTFLADTTTPEVFDLRDMTLKGALDALLPRSRGIGWSLLPEADGEWTVSVYTHDEDGTFVGEAAANPGIDIVASDYTPMDIQYTESALDNYEQVVIEGEPIVVAGTVSFNDNNLITGWSSDQSDAYLVGASASGDYDDLDDDKKRAQANDNIRESPSLEGVFSRYLLKQDASGNLLRNVPAATGSGESFAFVPDVSWNLNGTTHEYYLLCSDASTSSRAPYFPTARVLRQIPWPVGIANDGTDFRDFEAISRPQYLKPGAFRYLLSPGDSDESVQWLNLQILSTDDVGKKRGVPDIRPDDRAAGLIVKYSPKEIMAKGHWADDAGISPIEADGDDTPDSSIRSFNYQNLVLTVAVESDQKVRVSRFRDDVASEFAIRKTLVLKSDKLKCWLVGTGTILGIDINGDPDAVIVSSGKDIPCDNSQRFFVTRNDFPTAQRLLDMVCSFVFRKRRTMAMTIPLSVSRPTWAVIGHMLDRIEEKAADPTTKAPSINVECKSVVESISYKWDLGSPSYTVTTTMPDVSGLMSHSGLTQSGGGSVSAGIAGNAGTIGQRVQSMAREITRIRQDTQDLPLIAPRTVGASPNTAIPINNIVGGSVLNASVTPNINGIKYDAGTSITTVPNVNAAVPSIGTFAVGLGRGVITSTGATVYVALRPNPGSGVTTDIISDIPDNQIGLSDRFVLIPLVSDATVLVKVYLIYSF